LKDSTQLPPSKNVVLCQDRFLQPCIANKNLYGFQVDLETTETVVAVDWENGFVEASAKENTNVSQVFKELLAQAKVKYNLSPALRKRRRQSLPRHSISEGSASTSANPSSAIPSPAQLQHLQQIQQRQSGGKRNSCILS
jgi:hypothetical protein